MLVVRVDWSARLGRPGGGVPRAGQAWCYRLSRALEARVGQAAGRARGKQAPGGAS